MQIALRSGGVCMDAVAEGNCNDRSRIVRSPQGGSRAGEKRLLRSSPHPVPGQRHGRIPDGTGSALPSSYGGILWDRVSPAAPLEVAGTYLIALSCCSLSNNRACALIHAGHTGVRFLADLLSIPSRIPAVSWRTGRGEADAELIERMFVPCLPTRAGSFTTVCRHYGASVRMSTRLYVVRRCLSA